MKIPMSLINKRIYKFFFLLLFLFSFNLKAESIIDKIQEFIDVPFVKQYFNCNVFKTTKNNKSNFDQNNVGFVIDRVQQTINFNDERWLNSKITKLLFNKGAIKTKLQSHETRYIILELNRLNNRLKISFFENKEEAVSLAHCFIE